jgi:hypothetical protein
MDVSVVSQAVLRISASAVAWWNNFELFFELFKSFMNTA